MDQLSVVAEEVYAVPQRQVEIGDQAKNGLGPAG